MTQRPLCFVIMPFGQNQTPPAAPALTSTVSTRTRSNPRSKRQHGTPSAPTKSVPVGIIHKPMFERLLLCDYAVADLTTANANFFYELGVRHTARPRTTLTIFSKQQPIPFDVNFLRSLPYGLGRTTPSESKKPAHYVTR